MAANSRSRLERDGDRVRLITRGSHNWTRRYPWIVEAAHKVRQKRFVLDGEAVVLGVDGVSDFNALHSRKHDREAQFCAFDILVEGDDDLRKLPLLLRKSSLERLLARRPEGVALKQTALDDLSPRHVRQAVRALDRVVHRLDHGLTVSPLKPPQPSALERSLT